MGSELTSTGLEERSQLVLAAWAVSVCVGGGLPATWGAQVASGCSPPWLGGAQGRRLLQPRVKITPPDGGIPWG